jgi:hypothetical protein
MDYKITDDTCLYFGSHNFTPAAWGRIEVFSKFKLKE